MNFYMSYWSGGYKKEPDDYLIDLHKLSLHYVNKHYGKCTLITDTKSKKYFQHLPYYKITTELDELNGINTFNWALGKLVAYRNISENNQPFIHLDYDVFLLKPITNLYLTSPILVQSEEHNVWKNYAIFHFENIDHNKNDMISPTKNDIAYNMGIFGGNDLQFINYYSKQAIQFTLDQKNKKLFEELSHDTRGSRSTSLCGFGPACVAEQYMLWNLSKLKNKEIVCYLKGGQRDKLTRENDATEKGYVHLMGYKNKPHIIREVTKRLLEQENIMENKQ